MNSHKSLDILLRCDLSRIKDAENPSYRVYALIFAESHRIILLIERMQAIFLKYLDICTVAYDERSDLTIPQLGTAGIFLNENKSPSWYSGSILSPLTEKT